MFTLDINTFPPKKNPQKQFLRIFCICLQQQLQLNRLQNLHSVGGIFFFGNVKHRLHFAIE